jgi:hypothetical protein
MRTVEHKYDAQIERENCYGPGLLRGSTGATVCQGKSTCSTNTATNDILISPARKGAPHQVPAAYLRLASITVGLERSEQGKVKVLRHDDRLSLVNSLSQWDDLLAAMQVPFPESTNPAVLLKCQPFPIPSWVDLPHVRDPSP